MQKSINIFKISLWVSVPYDEAKRRKIWTYVGAPIQAAEGFLSYFNKTVPHIRQRLEQSHTGKIDIDTDMARAILIWARAHKLDVTVEALTNDTELRVKYSLLPPGKKGMAVGTLTAFIDISSLL